MKKIGMALGMIFVVTIFIVMAVVPSLGLCEVNTTEKWMQDHTVKVNSMTTCKYEQGYLQIVETYTGEELKERFGVEQFTKELKIPVEGKVLGMQEGEERIFVKEKVTVLTSGDDPPHWWDNYKYPLWAWSEDDGIYEKQDPINLVWIKTTKDRAKSEILEEGWYDSGTWYDFFVYDPVYGWIDDDNVADDPLGLFEGRYHARLWQMSDGNVAANAHHDCAAFPDGHEADQLEEAEELVAGYFNQPEDTEWNVYEDNYDLDNDVTDPYSNGWCTRMIYGQDNTPPTVDDFFVLQDSLPLGDSFIIPFTVSDTGGSGLKQVELWRAIDVNGDGEPDWPDDYIDIHYLSGDGPKSGGFLDSPASVGTYWYGIHVVDNAGNFGLEPDPPGPIEVEVTLANQPPTASASDINGQPTTMYPDTVYSVSAKYYDPDGRDDLKYCYLQLTHPSKPLTMAWVEATGNYWPYAGEEGANYLTITSVTSTQLTNGYRLTWSFRINDNWPETSNSIDFGVFAWDDGDLTSGWHYDNTDASFVVLQPPDPPSNLDAKNSTSNSIYLSWTKGSGSDKTMIRRKTGSYPSSPTDGSQAYFGTGTSTTDSDLSPGTRYYYRTWAYDSTSGYYSDNYDQDAEYTKPENPSNLDAKNPTSDSIYLSWTKGSGSDKTMIRRKTGSYPSSHTDGSQAYYDIGTSTTDSCLNPGTKYYYSAWAYDSDSGYYSGGCSQDYETTETGVGLPSVSTQDGSNVGTTSAQLNGYLDDLGGASSCDVWFVWDTSYHSDYNDYAHSTTHQTKYSTGSFFDTLSSLEPDTTYHFRAVASNSEGTVCGVDKFFTTSEIVDTTPPVWDITVGIQSAQDTGKGGQVRITYGTATDADSPPVKYNVYYSTTSPATAGTKLSDVGSSPYTVSGLTNGQLYYFTVRAADSASPPNEDTNSIERSATPTGPEEKSPKEEWNQTFGGPDFERAYQVQQTADDGYILAGETYSFGAGSNDALLVKTYPNGTEEWNRTFGGPDYDSARSVRQTIEGGYIMTGRTEDLTPGKCDLWLLKTYPNGSKQWEKTYGETGYFEGGNSVQQTTDGGYIIGGQTEGDFLLVKTSSNGDKEWDKTFGGTDSDDARSVQQTTDDGYVLAGYTLYGANYYDALLVKTDTGGIEQWNKTFGGTYNASAVSVQQVADEGYVVAGRKGQEFFGTADSWLLKTSSNGDKEWDKTFGGPANDVALSVDQTSDGGYIMAGYTRSYGDGECDVWLVKTDAGGNEQWNLTLGGPDSELAYSVQQTDDGGFIVGGETRSYGAGNADFWLIKLGYVYMPQVTTNPASDVTTNSATLHGNLDDTGGEDCEVWFEWGETTAYGNSTTQQPQSSLGPFSAILSNLDDDTPYHFRVVASNSKGAVYGDDMSFKTKEALQVDFTATNACFCTNVTFAASVTGGTPPYTYRWDFDNDGVYELVGDYPNPTWHYDLPGTYTARLNITDNNGNSDEITKLVTVYENPVANFVVSDVCYCTDTYLVDTSIHGDGNIVSWYWELGDGNTKTTQNVSWHYNAPGTYLVNLTVTDEYGCTDTVSKQVAVYENPIADFTATTVQFCEDMQFTSSVTNGTPPYDYHWDFNSNGAYELEGDHPNPTWNYPSAGIYNATLTVVDSNGCNDTIIKMVEVYVVPHTDVGVTVDIEPVNSTEIEPYLPSGTNLSNAIVIRVNVTDDTPENTSDDAYTDITIDVGALDIAACEVFKEGSGFLSKVDDVSTLPTVKPPGEAKFSQDEANNSVIVRLYAGDPLLAVIPPLTDDIFDTGEGTYPSISGIHNGTITPNQTITVSTLYIYPCPGTGGHAEYVHIYGNGIDKSASWTGYTGDWHNLTFDAPFTLDGGKTYNYEMRTGSYPQIIHTDEWEAEGGMGIINCTSFVDANGKVYNDWIPAFKLFL